MLEHDKVVKALKDALATKNDYPWAKAEMSFEFIEKVLELMEQPEIVRCKDCVKRGTYQCPVYVGGDGMHSEPDDWFCADGKRRRQ